MLGEVMVTLNRLDYGIHYGEKYLSPEKRETNLMSMHKSAWVEFVPFGLIGCIVPSNFPIQNTITHAIDAILAGNAVLLKLSEWGCWTSLWLQEILQSCLKACGHPPELIQFVNGYAETGTAVIDECDKILFIGSTGVGVAVQAQAAKTWTPVTLELGGKDAFIVLEDAKIDLALIMGTSAAFFNCGQNCVAAERYMIHESRYEEFIESVLKTYDSLVQGDDLGEERCDSGAVLVPAWLDRYEAMVKDAVAKGAELLRGGKRMEKDGLFFELTILKNCTLDMQVMKEETFGPFLCLMAFKDDEDLIGKVNASNFGLGMTIYGDNDRCKKIVARTKSGMVGINDFGLNLMISDLPFGGVGESGHGRFWGIEGMRDFTYPRAISAPFFGISLTPPPFLTVPTSKNAPRSVGYMLDIIYNANFVTKATSTFKLVRDLMTGDY
jgi:acyl-CoA reductase-like NAD-dependent aldehyde dehydrogenase